MAILSAMINALSCFHPELFELEDAERAARLLGAVVAGATRREEQRSDQHNGGSQR